MVAATSKSVKFKVSLKELSVEFEGDIQSAERMHSEITGAISSLAAVQAKMLPAAQKPAPQVIPAEVVSGGRTRRRRRRSGSGIDPAVLAGEVVASSDNGTEPDEDGARRSASGGPLQLITELRDGAFFAERRTIGDVRAALAAKGHILKAGDVSPVLVKLTRRDVLKREHDAAKDQWVYFVS